MRAHEHTYSRTYSQKQGISWMLEREAQMSLPPFWKEIVENGAKVYYNEVTCTSYTSHPAPVRGGLVCDDMGLGKTLQMLCLVVAEAKKAGSDALKGTLVVCPTSVLSNWAEQAVAHFAPDRLSVFQYHGANRELYEAGQYDLVLTTYGCLALELDPPGVAKGREKIGKKRKKVGGQAFCSLMDTQWRRVVLDEAHTIRNNRTKANQASCALKSTFRWCITGTPLQNKPEDIQSLLAFVRAAPLDDPHVFNRGNVTCPFSQLSSKYSPSSRQSIP